LPDAIVDGILVNFAFYVVDNEAREPLMEGGTFLPDDFIYVYKLFNLFHCLICSFPVHFSGFRKLVKISRNLQKHLNLLAFPPAK
jgi:hypothetical protein